MYFGTFDCVLYKGVVIHSIGLLDKHVDFCYFICGQMFIVFGVSFTNGFFVPSCCVVPDCQLNFRKSEEVSMPQLSSFSSYSKNLGGG